MRSVVDRNVFMRRIPVYRRRRHCQAQPTITVCTAQWMRL